MRNVGKHYTWVIPALRDHIFELALKGYVEKTRAASGARLSL